MTVILIEPEIDSPSQAGRHLLGCNLTLVQVIFQNALN